MRLARAPEAVVGVPGARPLESHAARSSPRGGGWAPGGLGLCPGSAELHLGRQARAEAPQESSWGAAKGGRTLTARELSCGLTACDHMLVSLLPHVTQAVSYVAQAVTSCEIDRACPGEVPEVRQ